MKAQQFTNWFKLMCGLSMLMVSTCVLINTISPAHASVEKKRDKIAKIVNAPSASTGFVIGNSWVFVDGGFLYILKGDWEGNYNWGKKANWTKVRLTTIPEQQLAP